MTRVLVLNLDYEPLNICNVPRAMKMVHVGKAEVLHFYNFAFRTGGGDEVVIPSVVRLRHNAKKKHIKSFRVSSHDDWDKLNDAPKLSENAPAPSKPRETPGPAVAPGKPAEKKPRRPLGNPNVKPQPKATMKEAEMLKQVIKRFKSKK